MFSPFEQFSIVSLFWFGSNNLFWCMFFLVGYLFFVSSIGFRLIGGRYQQFLEFIFSLVVSMVGDSLRCGEYVSVLYSLGLFIVGFNVIGGIPYGFTVTSHLAVTGWLALGVWIGKLLVGLYVQRLRVFSVLIPQGSPLGMSWFFVLVETIGFIVPVVSLAVRLFANLMSGHVLLSVLFGFSYSMWLLGNAIGVVSLFVQFILFLLLGLELAICFIQGYIFVLLTIIYLGDMEHGH